MTVRYAGMNNKDPILNIAKWEKRPRGGLHGVDNQNGIK